MGDYIIKDDIIEQLPEETLKQLTDDEGLDAINDGRVDAAIEDAEGEVNGYLQSRYSTPLSPVPAVVKKFTTDIAIYNLYARRLGAPEDREKRYKNAVKFLENVSRGIVTLGADSPQQTTSANDTSLESASRVFTRKSMEDF